MLDLVRQAFLIYWQISSSINDCQCAKYRKYYFSLINCICGMLPDRRGALTIHKHKCDKENKKEYVSFAFVNGMLQIAINLKSNQLLRWKYFCMPFTSSIDGRCNGSLSLFNLS